MTAEASLQTETSTEKKKRLAVEKKAKEAAAKEAAELEKKKQKQEEEAIKKAAQEAKAKEKAKDKPLKDLTEDYELKQIDGLWVPCYFHTKKRYEEGTTEQSVDIYHADNFLLGMEIFTDQGSCSAKITYIGPNRRYTLNLVLIGRREARPTHNNWKIFTNPIRMFKGTEHTAKMKDPKVIRDCLMTQGGKKNFKIRFVQDKEWTQKEVKKKVFAKDPVRLRNLNYRVKLDHTKMGIKPVLRNKEEALLLLKDLKVEQKDKKGNHVVKFLQEEIRKYEVIEAKAKAEAKKD